MVDFAGFVVRSVVVIVGKECRRANGPDWSLNPVVASVEGVWYTWRLCRSKSSERDQIKFEKQSTIKWLKAMDGRIETERRARWLVVGCCQGSASSESAPAETLDDDPMTWMRCGGVGGEPSSREAETRGEEACPAVPGRGTVMGPM